MSQVPSPSRPVTLAAPIFISVLFLAALLVMPAGVAAYDNIPQSDLLTFYCQDAHTLAYNSSIYSSNATGISYANVSGGYYTGLWNFSDPGWTFPISNFGVYYNMTYLIPGENNGFTYANYSQANGGSQMIADHNGTYMIIWSMSAQFGNGGEYGISVSRNYQNPETDEPSKRCYTRITGTAGLESLGAVCYMNLTAGDNIRIVLDDEINPSQNVVIKKIDLIAYQVSPVPFSVTGTTYASSNSTSFWLGSKTCMNGCSTTLNDCRLNMFWDNVAFALFVFISGCVVWFCRKLGPVGVVATVAVMLLSMLNLTWDVFGVNQILVRLFSIAVIVFGAIMLYSPYEKEEEAD